jgi:MATE family multidrug resistance protein
MWNLDKTNTRQLLKLSGPLIIANISQMFLGIMDAMMVGQISYKHLAASSLVINVVGIPYVSCIGLVSVISPLVAFLYSDRKASDIGSYLWHALILNTLICIVMCTLLHIFSGVIFHLGQDVEVVNLAKPFLIYMTWAILPMVIFFTFKQFSDGLEHTRFPMILSLLSIPFNFILNYALIYGNFGFPRWELVGSGLATLITRITIMIILIVHVLTHPKFKEFNLFRFRWDPKVMKKISSLGLPSAWQYSSEVGAFVVLGILSGWFGAQQQAAHQTAMSIAAFTFMVSLGLSTAGSIKVGEAFGNGKMDLAWVFGKTTIQIAFIYGLACGIIFIFLKNILPISFTNDPIVFQIASHLLVLAAFFQISDALQAVGIGLLRGLQDVKIPAIFTTVIYWFVGVPAGYFLSVHRNMKVYGIWIGFIISLGLIAVLLFVRFYYITRSGRPKF